MFKYAIRTAIRHLWLNRLFSSINIIGLVLGFTVTFCIASCLFYENSYDRTHPDVALSYRLISGTATGKLRDKSLNAYNFLPVTALIGGKVMGASVSSIVQLLSKDFLKLVVLSFAIATPVAAYFYARMAERLCLSFDNELVDICPCWYSCRMYCFAYSKLPGNKSGNGKPGEGIAKRIIQI